MRLPTRAQLGIDSRRLPTRFPFLAFVPQWDFLRFVTSEAVRYTGFTLVTQAEVEDLIVDNDQVGGVRHFTPAGLQEVRALLTVGADGRTSRVREAARLPLVETSPPMDVLWFRLSRRADDDDVVGFRLSPGHFFALINRSTHWQVAYVIPKVLSSGCGQRGWRHFVGPWLTVFLSLPTAHKRFRTGTRSSC
jgi:2-polyprenyl-6-methoxyphenol hydroxylase-like FAD-dependent oxidoreductase